MGKLYNNNMQGFTLLEVIIVVIIIGIIAAFALSRFQAAVIKSKMSEMYLTIDTIKKAEYIFYAEHGFMAAASDEVPGYDLWISTKQSYIDNFKSILGIEIPGMDSTFVYGVYGNDAEILVRVRDRFGFTALVTIYLEGPFKGTWLVRAMHPWGKYVHVP